jgi:hypothetical protein
MCFTHLLAQGSKEVAEDNAATHFTSKNDNSLGGGQKDVINLVVLFIYLWRFSLTQITASDERAINK